MTKKSFLYKSFYVTLTQTIKEVQYIVYIIIDMKFLYLIEI